MIRLKPIPADLSVLDQSHIFRGARLILAYADEQGPISLTPSKAFRRVFVNWAAEAFVWPHWTVEDLYRVNKVPPCVREVVRCSTFPLFLRWAG